MHLRLSASLIRRAAASTREPRWSDTLALPKSTFPARPTAAQLEQYRQRCADDLYAWQKVHRADVIKDGSDKDVSNEFILHDGPPYANGAVHLGHALNKILKDVIVRWQLLKGKRVYYRPGWDCHGLPIELKALQARRTHTEQANSLKDVPHEEAAAASTGTSISALGIREMARSLASETAETQARSFREWGVMGEWHAPYKTMDASFEVEQLGIFKDMVQNGLISRHRRPVYWSPSSRTALAEAELEYDDNHKCTAAFVKMPFSTLPEVLARNHAVKEGNVSALIWTTTPWTLPANQAIAVRDDMEYTVITLSHEPRDQLIVAKERLDYVLSHVPDSATVETLVDTVRGSDLADGMGATFNIFSAAESPVLKADFVTASTGTGVVHVAPGHGMEDYLLCEQNSVRPVIAPVDDRGCYTADAFVNATYSRILGGLDVQTAGVKCVLEILAEPDKFLPKRMHESRSSLVLAAHSFTHKNPIDWRTKEPVIVRATAQWFADISAIKDRALAAIDNVTFIPEGGKIRLRSFVEGRNQWCISRQRAWGVPIPALYHRETGEACITNESIDHIISVIKQKGSDAWFSDHTDESIWVHPSLDRDIWVRGKDTMDVWFDSGTTWSTLDGKYSDICVEGTDQHRGWFQSSLLTSISTQDSDLDPIAPYTTLVTHGFVLDAEGKKMSKSLGNVISPDDILNGSLLPPVKTRKRRDKDNRAASKKEGPDYDAMGPDVLRLWVGSSDYTRDVSISVPVLQSVQQSLQKYRVTFKFLVGVLANYSEPFSSDLSVLETGSFPFADKAILHQLHKTEQNVYQGYEEFKFHKIVTDINTFINTDLSAFYFEVIKDKIYAGSSNARRQTQDVLARILQGLMRMLGPVTPHLIEEVWEHLPAPMKREHPLRQIWVPQEKASLDCPSAKETAQAIDVFKTINIAVKLAQEAARNSGVLGSGLACKVVIHLPPNSDEFFSAVLRRWQRDGDLDELLVVSQSNLVIDAEIMNEQPVWRFEQAFDAGNNTQGKVFILPPEQEKCVRCWKFTAESVDVPCQRCRDVIADV